MSQLSARCIRYGAIALFLITFPVTVYAVYKATLSWDANGPADGYLLFGRSEGQNYNYDEPWCKGDSAFMQCTIGDLDESATYYFVARSYVGGVVSADSNEVTLNFANSSSNSDANTSKSSVEGSGGGGCFIESLL
jgi:hypothetical protein